MISLLHLSHKIHFLTVVPIRTPAAGHMLARCAIVAVWFQLGLTRRGWNVLVERPVPSALLALADVTREHRFPCSTRMFGCSKKNTQTVSVPEGWKRRHNSGAWTLISCVLMALVLQPFVVFDEFISSLIFLLFCHLIYSLFPRKCRDCVY